MDELSKKIIEMQDWFTYMSYNNRFMLILKFKDMDETLKNVVTNIDKLEDDILRNFSVKNLMHILYVASKDNKEKIVNILNEKLEKEPFDIEELATSAIGLNLLYSRDADYVAMNKNMQIKLKQDTLERGKKLKGTKCEHISEYFEKVGDYANFLTYYEKGIFNDDKIELLEQMIAENPKALNHVNFAIFEDNIFYTLGKENIKEISKYPNISSQIITIGKLNPNLFNFIAKEINKEGTFASKSNMLGNIIEYSFNYIYKIPPRQLSSQEEETLENVSILKAKSLNDEAVIDLPFSEDYEKRIKQAYEEELELVKNIKNDEELEYGYRGKYFTIHEKTTKLEIIKNIYFNKYFSMSINEANKLIEMYEEALKGNVGNDKEQSLLLSIKKVLDADDIESLKEIEKTSARSIEEYKRDLEEKYALTYVEELGKTQDKFKDLKERVININGENVTTYEMDGKFDFLVHSTDTSFLFYKTLDEEDNFKTIWMSQKEKIRHILSMSYINQDFLGKAPVGDAGVLYGFTNMPKDNIRLMGNTDINSYTVSLGYDAKYKKYLTASTMPYYSRKVYNEIGVEKEGIIPSCVIISEDFDEAVLKNSYKAAKDWNIPIIFIDKEKLKDRQIENLETLREEFLKTGNVEKLKQLLSTYETNVAGWLLNRKKDYEDESFSKGIQNEKFRKDFDNEYDKILETLDVYLEKEIVPKDLARIIEIVLEENDLYTSMQEVAKPLSETEMMHDPKTILEKLNNSLLRSGNERYVVDISQSEKLPSADEYRKKLSMQEIVLDALGGKDKVGKEDIEGVDKAKKDHTQTQEKRK